MTKAEYIIDYLTGEQIVKNPEEVNRQEMLRILHEDYGYPKEFMIKEFGVKKSPTKTIREILAEPTFEVLPPNCCNITCCNDRQNCSILVHPQDCLVWQLYHNTDKQKLETTYYD